MNVDRRYFDRSNESLEGIEPDEFMSLVRPKIEHAISLDGLELRLNEERPLNVKFGTDPTGPDLHLGHVVPIRLLDLFNRAGHNIDFIFGDFTAKIGDPTGRTEGRQILTDEQIQTNMATYTEQVSRFFDVERKNARILKNSVWLGKLSLADAFGYLQMINLSEAIQRKDFRDRMAKGKAVSLAEAVYGTLTGIDSVELNSDVELGGIDQLLNFQQARSVQASMGNKPQEILMTPIIEGTSGDGRKMSKSFDNYIPVNASPDDMYGKIMSIPDHLIIPYLQAFAPVNEAELSELKRMALENPLEIKKQLATYMVAFSTKSMEKGYAERENFEKRYSKKDYQTTENVIAIEFTGPLTVAATLAAARGKGESNTQILRLFRQGAVRVIQPDNKTIVVASPEELLEYSNSDGQRVKVGKQILQFANSK